MPPSVVGKADTRAARWCPPPVRSTATPSPGYWRAASLRLVSQPGATLRIAALNGRARLVLHAAPVPARAAAFCSGCPHNISTRAADDQLVGLGIGCHVMAGLDPTGRGTRWA